MNRYRETFNTWNKVASLYQDKFMDLDLYNETYDFICNSIAKDKAKLLEATNESSPISKFIEKKGEGIHHIAFAVDDISSEVKRLKKEGFIVLNEIPKKVQTTN